MFIFPQFPRGMMRAVQSKIAHVDKPTTKHDAVVKSTILVTTEAKWWTER
jgi:hypothetical protein